MATALRRVLAERWARLGTAAALIAAALNPGCRCHGGDENDPDDPDDDTTASPSDDDLGDDDSTTSDHWGAVSLEGFHLEVATGEDTAWEGVTVDGYGMVFTWVGALESHDRGDWRGTLTTSQMYTLATGLGQAGFFDLQSQPASGALCDVAYRQSVRAGEVQHPADAVPDALSPFYGALAGLLAPFDIDPVCDG